jgi:hypothetical protein
MSNTVVSGVTTTHWMPRPVLDVCCSLTVYAPTAWLGD